MIELVKNIGNEQTYRIGVWLQDKIRPYLTTDVSKYAKDRLRGWLDKEPQLVKPFDVRQGIAIDQKILNRLKEIIGWDFDFCLVTYSGNEFPIGISQHRDAGIFSYEAYGLNVTGECKFDYWCQRNSFDAAGPSTKDWPADGPSSDTFLLKPGDLVRFNCKCPHSAVPGIHRWNINFWKRKPNVPNNKD